ncbi:hypothetical protein EV361DRAFT_1001583, partial [Lentinula raphanica]
RQVPCTSCQRRGCAALCPNGSLATGQGTRFVLAATEHLHRRIARLSGRIRELEDALANIHSKYAPDSDQPHPLLENDWLLEAEEGADDDELEPGNSRDKRGTGEVIDAFGTLSISNHGISRFFGPTGGSESLLVSQITTSTQLSADTVFTSNTTISTGSTSTFDPRITLFSHNFPFTPLALPPAQIQELIESYLPAYERARELVNIYFEQVAWIFRGISREQLDEEMVGAIYARPSLPSPAPLIGADYSGPHDLALLFIVFALAALVEPYPSTSSSSSADGSSPNSNPSTGPASRPSPNSLGEHYYQLAQASLSLQPVLEKPSIVTIQCLHVMSIYNAMSGEGTANPASDTSNDTGASTGESKKTGQSETSMEMTWSLITMAAHLSQTVLERTADRDSERWGLSPKIVQRRRILFWDLFVADVWQSLNTGRPPSFSLAYIDCSFPQYEGVNMKDGSSQGNDNSTTSAKNLTVEIWQFRFASECLAEVVSRTLTAETPTYATIMDLDRKVREFPLPENFIDRGADSDMSFSFMKCVLDHIRETVLMYIHRSFFAQAIIDQPTNPLKSVYAPSFLAAYRAAATILRSVREQFILWPNSCARFWTMWTFAFSAAVVFGTVVTRGPRSPLAASAMGELDQACILFSKAATYSKRATKALPILTTLREKARLALAAAQSKNPEKPLSDGELWNIKKEESDPNDELSIFAGHTRLVAANNAMPMSSESSNAGLQNANTTNGWYGQNARHRENHEMHHPPTISIPPAPVPSSMDERSPHQPMQFNFSYDRSSRSGPSPIATTSTYSWSPNSPYPPRHSSSPVRLTHPQYGAPPASTHSDTTMHAFHNPPLSAHMYSGPGVAGFVPPVSSHPLPMQPPGNSALADLGLASRDSRLDERWSSFMQDSGLLDEVNFGRGAR